MWHVEPNQDVTKGICLNRVLGDYKDCTLIDRTKCNEHGDWCMLEDKKCQLRIPAPNAGYPPAPAPPPPTPTPPTPTPTPPTPTPPAPPSSGSICVYSGCLPGRLSSVKPVNTGDVVDDAVVALLTSFKKKSVTVSYNGAFGYSGNSSLSSKEASQVLDKVAQLTALPSSGLVLMCSQDFFGSVIQVMSKSDNSTGNDRENTHLIANPAFPNFKSVKVITYSYDTSACGACNF